MRVFILLSFVLAYSQGGSVIGQIEPQPQQGQAEQQVTGSPSPSSRVEPAFDIKGPTGNQIEREGVTGITLVDERSPWPNWIANIISFLLLSFVDYQSYLNNENLKAMKEQLSVMRETLQHDREQALKTAMDAVKQLHVMDKQALISETQLEIAAEVAKISEGQLVAMKAQAKTMDQSLVFGTRAYLGIENVFLDTSSRRIVLHIKNAGRVPAKNVILFTEIKAQVPETKYRAFCGHAPQMQDWSEKDTERHLEIPFMNRLGRTKVFPGNLRIPIIIRLDNTPYMSEQQFALITGGYAEFQIRGLITYSDGFNSGKRTEFAFRYFGKNSMWVPELIDGPEIQTGPERSDSDYTTN